MILNPHALPKIRSEILLRECANMPCELRLAGFVGMQCEPQNTVVGCHLPTIGKGTGTKVSDLFVSAGCRLCHSLLDMDDRRGMIIRERYPSAFMQQIMRANHATISRWVIAGLIEVKGADLV